MKLRSWKSALLVVALGAFVVTLTYALPPRATVPGALAAAGDGTSLLAGLGPYAVADVAEKASPSVVYIEVEYKAPERSSGNRRTMDLFDMWFGGPSTPSQGAVSQGSGVIITDDGQVLTNQHVVDNSANIKEIRVYVEGRKDPYTAKLLGSDRMLDLAVLKIEPNGKIIAAAMGDSNKSRVGEFVVAIGNPYGKDFDHTVTVGVLSAKGREISIPDPEAGDYRRYTNLMQTDAAINPGNSGGPLLNLRGEVIGINTAVRADGQGMGFAIPINVAKGIVDDLVKKGKVERPYIGIEYGDITADVAEYLGLTDKEGVLISSVFRGTPAAKAGLQPGDVVRKLNNQEIKNQEGFKSITEKMKIGDKLNFVVDRSSGGKVRSMSIIVTVGTMPAE